MILELRLKSYEIRLGINRFPSSPPTTYTSPQQPCLNSLLGELCNFLLSHASQRPGYNSLLLPCHPHSWRLTPAALRPLHLVYLLLFIPMLLLSSSLSRAN